MHPTAASARSILSQASGDVAAGIVAAWGPVEVHGDGFRARRARPHTLIIPRGAKRKVADRIRRIAAAYEADVLEARADELLAHCRQHGLGLDQAAIDELLGDALAAERWRQRRRRALVRAGYAAAAVAAVAVLIGAVHWWPTIEASLRGTPARIPAEFRQLAVLEQHVIDNSDGESVYIAVVRNEHPTETALGVFVAGTLRDANNEVRAELDSRLDTENLPVLAPGDTGVVVNVLTDSSGLEDAVTRYRTRAMARVFRRAAPGPAVRLSQVQFDRRSCLLHAVVQSDRRRLSAGVIILAYDRRGDLAWGDLVDVGPLRKGRSHQVLQREEPRVCAAPPARFAAYANLAIGQVIRGTRG